jgi:hypothetical protein
MMWAVAGISAICGVLLAGCGGGKPAAATVPSQPVASSAAEASPTLVDSPTPEANASPVAMTVVAPKTLLGRSPATESTVKGLATTAAKGFKAPAGKVMVSGAYGSTKLKNIVVVVAVTGDIHDGDEFLDAVVKSTNTKSTFHTVQPGPLGGAARCADPSGANPPSTYCMWADNSAFGQLYFLYGAAADADALLAQARGEIEVP